MQTIIEERFHIDDLIKNAIISRDHFTKLKEELCKTIHHSKINKDVRYLNVASIEMQLQNFYINLKLIKNHYFDMDDWKIQNNINAPFILLSPLLDSLRIGVFFNSFAYFEYYIRIICKKIGLQCKGFSIKNLTDALLDELDLNSKYKEFFKIISYIRNSVHLSGIYVYPSTVLTYKNSTYSFNQNEAIDFFTYQNMFFFMNEISEMMREISLSNKIISIDYIEHDVANINFI